MTAPAPDQSARDRIAGELGATMFVEAGAGSGKTSALVTRLVELVATGAAELGRVAAITFTDKAAAELRDQVRRRLQQEAGCAADAGRAQRCEAALGELDGAAIGTLHFFARRILGEHPLEAHLPPSITVLDEVGSGVAFEARWSQILDELLGDPALERTLLLLSAAGVGPPKLRSLAAAFDASWDLVEDQVPAQSPPPPPVGELVAPVLEEIDALAALGGHCGDPADRLLAAIGEIAAFGAALESAHDDIEIVETLLAGVPRFPTRDGRKQSWGDRKGEALGQVRAVKEAVESVRRAVLDACAHHLGSAMRAHTLAAAHARRRAGELEFHDLLVLARQLLRDPVHGPSVRRRLQDRYQRLLLDEFQDTDPIQIELAVRIAAADPEAGSAGSARWAEVEVGPGRIFVVGDPKQSIYRFRRADIITFLEARERFAPAPEGPVELVANFRTVQPILDWVDHTFATLMEGLPQAEGIAASRPPYHALAAQRPPPAPHAGPPVSIVGRDPHPARTRADDVRAAEARDVARAITTAMEQEWQVLEDRGGARRWRNARLGDIAVLVPARTSLPFLEDALDAARIAFRTESSSLVYSTRPVRDLLMVLRAADDPTDSLAVVAALRTPLLACGDDDLFRHKVLGGGSWRYDLPDATNAPGGPGSSAGPVAAGLAFLRELHAARHWESPAELAERVARYGRAFELGFAEGRPREHWRRLRFVIDQARAWSDAGGVGLRDYLRWVLHQGAEGARVVEPVLPETDHDAVRIMTIHAAKGLEFPIVILSGMSTSPQAKLNAVDVVFPRDGGKVGYRLARAVKTEEFEAWRPIDEQMAYDERVRLLYVACTRARDHLVVSLHRCQRSKEPVANPAGRTNAELLVQGMGDRLAALADAGSPPGDMAPSQPAGPPAALEPPAEPPEPPGPASLARWREQHEAALAASALPSTVAATALVEGEPHEQPATTDPGLQKRPRDLDLPPWLKGRYGTAVGRAVHGVLQAIDLATGEGVGPAVAAQCQAEAIPDRSEEVRSLVRAALAAPVVREAARRPHWREVYVCAPLGDRLLEGYIDLLFRSEAGLVVVDYKTASSAAPAELDRRMQAYRMQGGAYAWGLSRCTGEPVAQVVFVFLTPTGAMEREMSDRAGAVAEVQARVAAGSELVAG